MAESSADALPDVEPTVLMSASAMLSSAQLARLPELATAEAGGAGEAHVPSEQALADVLAAVDASTAANTKAAYRSDWARFTLWAGAGNIPPLPAPPLVVAHYITEAAAEMTGVGKWRYTPTTLTRWVSSINQFHTAAGHNAPGRSEVVRRALSGIRRIRATPPVRRAPLLLEDIRTLLTSFEESVAVWPAGVAARRDMALLLIGFAGAHRRSELVALTLADVTLHHVDGLHVRLRRSKTDQETHGQVKALPYGRDPVTCPPCAFVRWREILDAVDTTDPGGQRRAVMRVLRHQAAVGGASEMGDQEREVLHVCRTTSIPDPTDPNRGLFPTVHKSGTIGERAMSGDAVNEMIRRRAVRAGFTSAQTQHVGAHSLRSGFVTEAIRAGADAHAIMRQTGNRSQSIRKVYAREHAPLVGDAVTRIGL